MKIGILLVDFSPGRMGGVETYVRNLISHLLALDTENSYTLICNDRNVDYFAHLADRVTFKVFANRKSSPGRLARSLVRKVSGIDLIQVAVDRLGLDLLHNPFTTVRSSCFKTPVIGTFHDLQHHFLPHFFKTKEIQRRNVAYSRVARESAHLIAVSSFTATTVHQYYQVPLNRITTVPLGVAPEYRPWPAQALLPFRNELGLDRPFLYFPAATWGHKNHSTLFEALRRLIKLHDFDGDLVLTGVAVKRTETLKEELRHLGIADRVHILGYLPYEQLPRIYSMARLLVFPSLFEGFGMPVLEAMACGCPVLCSNVTSLPEVAGDAAEYFDPSSADDLLRAIQATWSNETGRAKLRAEGLKRAAKFSWNATAQATLNTYSSVIDRIMKMQLAS